jgi:hypothetical protein
MEPLQAKYEKLINQETSLLQKIRTAEGYVQACLDHTYRISHRCDVNTAESMMSALNGIDNELRTELLFVRFEKAITACQMKQAHE